VLQDPKLAESDDSNSIRIQLQNAEREVEQAAAEIAAMRVRLAAAQAELSKACDRARNLRARQSLLEFWREPRPS